MRIVLLGSGNVATHLGQVLQRSGNEILQVWSRSMENAAALASILQAEATDRVEEINPWADLYIISVIDDAIKTLADSLSLRDKLLVHTSGTTDLNVLENTSSKTGVFYPLQTFSKQKPVDFSAIPIAIEGSSLEVTDVLSALAGDISNTVVELDAEKRKALHVAAVFACNFSNHLYTLSKEILLKNQLDFNLIRPLIAETAAKVQQFEPETVQTGPAIRQDESTLNKHLEFLKNDEVLLELYNKLSQNIINYYKPV